MSTHLLLVFSKDFLGVLKIEILRDLEWQLFQFSKFLKIKVIMKLNATNVTAKFKNNIWLWAKLS